jgi:hypothetical protein
MIRIPPPQPKLSRDHRVNQCYWLLVDEIILGAIKADRSLCQFYRAAMWTVSDVAKVRVQAIRDHFEGYPDLEDLISEAKQQVDKSWDRLHQRVRHKDPPPPIPEWILANEKIINNLFQYKCNLPILPIMVIAHEHSERVEGEKLYTVSHEQSFITDHWKEAIDTVNKTFIEYSAKYPHLADKLINSRMRNLTQREVRRLFKELGDAGIYPEHQYKGRHGAKYSVTGYISNAGRFPAKRFRYPQKTRRMEKAMREIYINREIRQNQLVKT